MCRTSSLESYAEQICSSAKLIDAYCLSIGHPYPSFDPQAPAVTLPSTAPLSILTARERLTTAALKIQQLVTEPSEYVPRLAVHFQNFACIHWLCHFRILSFIPLQGSVPYSEVATISGVLESRLKSVARMAMLTNFLCEPKPNELAHTAPSALLVTKPNLLDWALFMAEATSQGAAKLVEATEKWGVAEQKNQTAFNIAKSTDLPFFDYLAQTPDLRKKFAAYMENVTASEGTKIEHLVSGFDWNSLGEATVVDVGGSNCHASIALATAYPRLRFIVQDLPETIASAHHHIAPHAESVRSRISFQAHDFFTVEPVRGANVYLLRMILHDWPVPDAINILRNLLPALKAKDGSRLLIMDTVVPTPGSIPAAEESMLRVRDLTMIQTFNSSERELDDWEQLFAQVGGDGGSLVLKNIIKPFGSAMSVMEVVYAVNGPEQVRLGGGIETQLEASIGLSMQHGSDASLKMTSALNGNLDMGNGLVRRAVV